MFVAVLQINALYFKPVWETEDIGGETRDTHRMKTWPSHAAAAADLREPLKRFGIKVFIIDLNEAHYH